MWEPSACKDKKSSDSDRESPAAGEGVADKTCFFEKVYAIVARIPIGKVATYGQIAAMAGSPYASRVVGGAMHKAPKDRHLPCHRVVNRYGQLAPDAVFGGRHIQRALLAGEGIAFLADGHIDLEKHLWSGSGTLTGFTETELEMVQTTEDTTMIRELTQDDWNQVHTFCIENPGYFILESGPEADRRAAEDIYQSLPPGKTVEDKFIYGYFPESGLAGIAEGIRDYPQPGTWVIGLFIIAEGLRGQSHGKRFLQQLEVRLKGGGAGVSRIGVLDGNKGGMRFWESNGYCRTGEIKEMDFSGVVHQVHVLKKVLA